MSGFCGWIGRHGQLADSTAMVEAMAAPVVRFGGQPLQLDACAGGALAGAGIQLYRQDGLRILVWGIARLHGAAAGHDGPGPAWTAIWRSGGARALCERLRGAFALCLLDDATGEALLATDRLGTRPLLYRTLGKLLAFASCADSLRRCGLPATTIDPQGLYNYVFFHMLPTPGGIYREHLRLAPGCYLHYRQGRVDLQRYWQIEFDEQQQVPFAERKREFRQLLASSVREAAGAHRVGAFLSGGTDSSTLAGVLTEVSGVPARSYSIGFAADGYDEMVYARLAAAHFGTDHHEYYVSADDVVEAVPYIAAVFDQPFGNASAVPAYYCARMAAADGVTHLIGGDGGDELFGGNDRYARQQLFALYQQVPAALRNHVLEPVLRRLPGAARLALLRKARSYIAQASVPMPSRLETYNLLHRYGPRQVFTADFLTSADTGTPLRLLEDAYGSDSPNSLINRMLALDLRFTLADNDLPKVSRACELAGVEALFPFLNDDMVAFSARLPPQDKLHGRQLRYFFKQALADFLPAKIINKPKHGFGLPFGVWLQQHRRLRALAGDSLQSLRRRHLVRGDFLDRLQDRHLDEHAGYHGTMIWVLMMLEQWFQQHQE
jgi:asparagine synthase (glutamine-hydrolysing)